MFEALYLTKSKIRQDILRLYFSNTDRKYYLREMERLLGYSAGNIRRELLRLQRDNLFITQRVGNLLYYSLNPDHALFEELKSIVSKTVGIEASLEALLHPLENIRVALIFGSFASRNEKETSDIDVLVIGKPNMSLLNQKVRDLEQRLKREINISVYTQKEYRARKKSESGFVMDILRKPKIMLIGNEDGL
jgi:predicted nucleotidyltransferase